MLTPPREEFLKLAEGRAMPVYADLLADLETPLTAYWKLAHDEPLSFLLESVTGGEQVARYSILGVRPRAVMRQKDAGDPLLTLAEALAREVVPVEGLPRFCGGAVGMLGYDFVRYIENIPSENPDPLGLDDMAMMLTKAVVVFDHAKHIIRIIVIADGTEAGHAEAEEEIARIKDRLQKPLPSLPSEVFPIHEVSSNCTQDEFEAKVMKTKEYIAAGDGIQVVLSQRFSKPADAHPVTIYRALRSLNPSPYMFLIRFGDFDLIGASPELLVSHHTGKATVRPIAGTRPRGNDDLTDAALADELLADEKERAEHLMLIDLGRNDLGRVCATGTVRVNHLMQIERYSHVMHIVSEVHGVLDPTRSVFDLVRATFPAGTLSGAPKVRAMQIIEELETSRRGLYGGAVGTLTPFGDVDLAIAIRTILLKDGIAHVQAGAGVVMDSNPTAEWQETWNKASAALRALDLAQSGL